MLSKELTKAELEALREVEVHRILGMENRGRRISMRCPFHNERTPSFMLYPDSSFKCFGCGVHGQNSIDFLIALGMTFTEAVEEIIKIS